MGLLEVGIWDLLDENFRAGHLGFKQDPRSCGARETAQPLTSTV
jgi:hypothetical protein